jgi:hypothetical protein
VSGNGSWYKEGFSGLPRIFPTADGEVDERTLWDSVAQEPARLAGTPVRFYSLRRAANRHPLYREPTADNAEWSYLGPFEVYAAIEFDQGSNITPEAQDSGTHRQSTATCKIARKEFEDASAPYPKEGDVIEFWAEQTHPFASPRMMGAWDVKKAVPDGQMFGAETYVQWQIELVRNERFLAQRKLGAPSV